MPNREAQEWQAKMGLQRKLEKAVARFQNAPGPLTAENTREAKRVFELAMGRVQPLPAATHEAPEMLQ